MKRANRTKGPLRGLAGLALALVLTATQALAADVQLVLDKSQPAVNQSFSAADMLPGDAVEQQYLVQVHRTGQVELLFDVVVTGETKDLGGVLNIRVTDEDAGTVLAEGAFDRVAGQVCRVSLPDGSGRVDRAFSVRVWLDTSVGNEYQNASLKADFRWYVEGEPASPDTPAATAAPGQGQLLPSQTGDESAVGLWVALGVCAAAALAYIWVRKGRGGHE